MVVAFLLTWQKIPQQRRLVHLSSGPEQNKGKAWYHASKKAVLWTRYYRTFLSDPDPRICKPELRIRILPEQFYGH